MQSIDNQLNQEGFDGKFKQPTIAEIHYKALMYEQLIQNKLQLNFPHFNNSLVEMYCPISNHNHKKISHVCLNQFCSNFRLNCFDCSQDGNHCAHHKDQKEIIELKNFIETKALEYQDTVKKINNLQNQLIQMFDEVKLNIQQQYDISFNMLNQMDIFQINDTLQNLIQFNTHLDPSYEIISNNTQHLVNSLNEFIQAIQENQKSNTTCFQEKIMKNNKLNDLQNHSDQSNQFGDYNQEKSNNFIKDYVNIAKINQSPQFSNGQYISNEQYSNNLNNQQQLQNKLIEFLKKFELPINNNTHPTIQNILNSINNNYEKLKEDIKKLKLSYNPNSKFKTYADYAIRQLPSGNLREQFRLHQIFHLFYSYLDAEKKNGRIINIFEYLAYVKISQQNDFGNFLIYFEQQKCILQKQPHFVNQQNSQNLNNQLYWQDDYYYELFKNFSNIYGYQII
ncbi:unnamed protein product [Paramecium sonneborni]|uniref:Uncharacterized protein n=1 Tax=Paramecium sonneborni TaxID=65129 RepID=A0A8S1NIQ9_9CILI|nr:unnamed protein product [Paramecium sonneborni]